MRPILLLLCALISADFAFGQPFGMSYHPVPMRDVANMQSEPAINTRANAEVDAIRCWWKADRSEIRVGQELELVLTCQLVNSDMQKVQLDEGLLDSAAVSLPPYEVIRGSQGPDIFLGDLRFVQYVYALKIIREDVFDSDVPVPALVVKYRISQKMQTGEMVNTGEKSYILLPYPIHIATVVPADAKDIRDADKMTFSGIHALGNRALAAYVLAAFLLIVSLALGMHAFSVAHYPNGDSGTKDQAKTFVPFTEYQILGCLRGELRNLHVSTGWSRETTSRFLGLIRILAAISANKTVHQSFAASKTIVADGQFLFHRGILRRRYALVSSSATAEAVNHIPNGLSKIITDCTATVYMQPESVDAAYHDWMNDCKAILAQQRRRFHPLAEMWRKTRKRLSIWSRV